MFIEIEMNRKINEYSDVWEQTEAHIQVKEILLVYESQKNRKSDGKLLTVISTELGKVYATETVKEIMQKIEKAKNNPFINYQN